MVQQCNNTMGEDRISTSVDRKTYDVVSPCRHRHSSVISSCSEDAESESTSAGYPSTHDEERDEELEYGPGIVNKLKTRYLSIALKQNRGTNMRRSCSMENLLDQDRSSKSNGVEITLAVNGIGSNAKRDAILGNLKRAKSMDTLLSDLHSEAPLVNGEARKEPRIIRRRDGGLNRTIPMICDEELPKPDTVKTYKRMFEPAESRRGSHCRRPPVLRASAKSSALAASKSNGILSCPSAKMNGSSTKSKPSAKQSPVTKAQSNVATVNGVNGISRKPCTKDVTKALYNGSHVVKANPIKMVSSMRSNKDTEKEMNNINRLLNQKEVHFAPKTEIICNGNSNHKEDLKVQDQNGNKESVVETVTYKPKVPPNKPSLKPPKPLPKLQLVKSSNNNKDLSPKLKLSPINYNNNSNRLQNGSEPEKISENKLKFECKAKEEKPLSPRVKQVEESKSPPEVSKLSNSPDFKEINNAAVVAAKNSSQIRDASKSDAAPQEKKTAVSMKETTKNSKLVEKAKTKIVDTSVKIEPRPVKKLAPAPSSTSSMVFDFRGKDVVPHVAILPVPFGCKSLHPKKRPILIDGKESPNGNGVATDDEDEDYVDYSVPLPCGVIFEGENVKIGRGSILSIRNKDLKITFDDDVDNNTFVYPSESSLLEESERSLSPSSTNDIIPNDQPPPTPPKLKTNTVIGNGTSGPGGLSTYTPSVLRTMDNFEPGMFRPPPAPVLPEKEEENRIEREEEENTVRKEEEKDPDMLKPADPDIISSWSLSASTSDLLF